MLCGDESLLYKTSIAIVGSRDCDNYGKEQTKRFASYLAQKNICIVSGLARGVDSIAHYYSKDKEGKTVAVLASGFEHIYPPENKILFEEILNDGGCIITEWPPETEIDMHRFPIRNRIISGISVGTLVVEAKYRSGTNITAHDAMKQRREVFCIPGDIDSIRSYGANRLIDEGANLVTSPKDIIDILEIDGYVINNKSVEPEYNDVYKLVGTIPITANEVVRLTKKNISEVNEILLMLELDEFIKQASPGKYVLN
ncbi:MAG: DNA-processing protein DprA [Clostridia bacterium]|nr:DNA-processing protein DprA [Clostridia bacterium]